VNIIEKIAAIWGVICFAWFILSYFNIAPFYEIKLIPKDSVEPFINVFSGQDVQLDFNKASYFRSSEALKADWKISDGKHNYMVSGLRPIFKLPDSYEGIYNLSLNVLLINNKMFAGMSNIYVVQQKTNIVKTTKTIEVNIREQESSNFSYIHSPNFVGEKIKNVEVYSDNNKWLEKEITKTQGNSFSFKLNTMEQIKTVNDRIILRYKSPDNKSYNYISIPEN